MEKNNIFYSIATPLNHPFPTRIRQMMSTPIALRMMKNVSLNVEMKHFVELIGNAKLARKVNT